MMPPIGTDMQKRKRRRRRKKRKYCSLMNWRKQGKGQVLEDGEVVHRQQREVGQEHHAREEGQGRDGPPQQGEPQLVKNDLHSEASWEVVLHLHEVRYRAWRQDGRASSSHRRRPSQPPALAPTYRSSPSSSASLPSGLTTTTPRATDRALPL